MKIFRGFSVLLAASLLTQCLYAQSNSNSTAQVKQSGTGDNNQSSKKLFIDVHYLGAGKVNFEAVAAAHAKDLATEGKYDVHFLKYWVDEARGTVYCLSSTSNSDNIRKTHAEAHGLLPDSIYEVTAGKAAAAKGPNDFFLDVHQLGQVSAADVAAAHKKDLATEGKYGVNFINYFVDEKAGVVMCLSQAPDSSAIIKTHKEAHGLLPAYIGKVKQGQ